MAVKVSDTEYNLILQDDVNTNGFTQWFFFRVENTQADLTVKFNLINFQKKDSLFNHGMKPLIYSLKTQQNEKGWVWAGHDIAYFQNGLKKEKTKKSLSTLTFSFTFPFDQDVVYFAYSFPYTYSNLLDLLYSI